MAYIELKRIHGRIYKYKRISYRVGDKVKHKSIYLEPVEHSKSNRKGQARKPEVFVRSLNNDELKGLQKAKKSSNSFMKDRATTILLSKDRMSISKISEKTNKERRSIAYAIKEFNAKGINALQRGKAKGAIPKFSEEQKKIILLHFTKAPQNFSLTFTAWTLPRFRKHLIDYKVIDSISIETLRQILNAVGARLKRSKRWQYSPDPEFNKKNLQ